MDSGTTMRGLDSARAWTTVGAAFATSFVTLGVAYSFGAFFESMATEFGSSRAATAVIFGITTCTFFCLSLLTGRGGDIWGPRAVIIVGTIAYVAGLWVTSLVNSLAVGYITYGAGVGIAAACGYIPMVAMVGGWFERRRATAVGIAVAGIGAGTLVISPVSAWMIEQYGWRPTFRFLAVAGGVVLALCALVVIRPPGQIGPVPSRFTELLRSRVFRRLQFAAFCSGVALFIPFVFVGQYAKDRGVDAVRAAVLVGLLGGASIVARIGFGTLVRRFGALRLYRLCFVLLAVAFATWLFAGSSYAVLVLFVLLLGVGYGGFVALSTIVLAELFGVVGLGSTMGLFYVSQGIGGLLGPPLAGLTLDALEGYRVVIVACIGLEIAAWWFTARHRLGIPVGSEPVAAAAH